MCGRLSDSHLRHAYIRVPRLCRFPAPPSGVLTSEAKVGVPGAFGGRQVSLGTLSILSTATPLVLY